MKRRFTANRPVFGLFLLFLSSFSFSVLMHWVSASHRSSQVSVVRLVDNSENPTIGATVKDETGTPIPNATVELGYPEPQQAGETDIQWHTKTLNTDGKGQFTINEIAKSSVAQRSIHLKADGFPDVRPSTPAIESLLDHSAILTMPHGFVVTGKVVDQHGNPIARAKLTSKEEHMVSNDDGKNITADAQGKFVFPVLRPGTTPISVQVKGFTPQTQVVEVGPDIQPVTFILAPGNPLVGQVVNADGTPITGATVHIERWPRYNPFDYHARTNAQGHFSIADAPAEQIDFTVDKDGYQSGEFWGINTDAQNQVYTLKITPSVSGTVTDAVTHQPLASFDALVGGTFAKWRGPQYQYDRNVKHFTNGNYQMKCEGWEGEATYFLRVEADGYFPAVSDPLAGQMDFSPALRHGPDVRGKILNPDGSAAAKTQVGLALPGAQLSLFSGQMNRVGKIINTGDDGSFDFRPEEGDVLLLAMNDNGYANVNFHAGDDKPLNVTLTPWSSVTGIYAPARDDGNHEDFNFAAIPVRLVGARNPYLYIWDGASSLSAQGQFSVTKLPSFDGELLQFSASRAGEWYTFTGHLSPGKTTELNIGMTGSSVHGLMKEPLEAHPDVQNSRAFFVPEIDKPITQWPATDSDARAMAQPMYVSGDSKGGFHLQGMPPGKYLYSVSFSHGLVRGEAIIPDGDLDMKDINLDQRELKVGDALPDELAKKFNGSTLHASDLAGKLTVLAWWGILDGGGQEDFDMLQKLNTQLDALGVNLLSVNNDADYYFWNGFPTRPREYPDKQWISAYAPLDSGRLFTALNPQGALELYVFDAKGKLAAKKVPMDNLIETVKKLAS